MSTTLTHDDIIKEFNANGRVSLRTIQQLHKEIESGPDIATAIELATDLCLFELIEVIASRFRDPNELVRWNALESVLTRFRQPRDVEEVLRIAQNDPSAMVRGVALSGLGEVFGRIGDRAIRRRIVELLVRVVTGAGFASAMRAEAYNGVLAANDVLPLDRVGAEREFDPESDIDESMIRKLQGTVLGD